MKWYQRLFRYPEVWVLTIAALATRLFQLQLPPAVVFDELYFRGFAANYLSGNYFFDIHPPLIKLIFAWTGSIFGLEAAQLSGGDQAGLVLRVLPALAGAALVPLVYVIIRQCGLGRRVAILGALLILLDNALLVESRFILMDSMLLLFGFGALSSYLLLRKAQGAWRWVWTVLTAVLIGALVSTKWSGLAIAGLLAVLWLIEGIRDKIDWRRLVGESAVVLTVVATMYIGSFMVHFSLLPASGEGDAFMSQKLQSTLEGNQYYDASTKMAFWDKFIELNEEMYTAQASLNGVDHPYASAWYTWPLEFRPVYYWQGESVNGLQGNIYLLGNPAVWWLSTLGVLVALVLWLGRPKLLGRHLRLVGFLLTGYAVNFIPFAFIDRPMFLYHYLFALVFAILLTCVLAGLLFDWQRRKYGARVVVRTFWVVITIVLLGFLYFLPLSYGWPLSSSDLNLRMWLPSWR